MTTLISNDDPGSHGRHTRLMRALAACQSFVCLTEEPGDQGTRIGRFNRALVEMEDEAGHLRLLWQTEADRTEFADLMELSWRYQLEGAKVTHAVYPEI